MLLNVFLNTDELGKIWNLSLATKKYALDLVLNERIKLRD